MKDFAGRTAVVTGGGTGIGRELVRQLVAEGCNVATCDVSARTMAETVELCQADGPPQGTRLTTHVADVSVEAQLQRFQAEAAEQHQTDKLNLLFNNAGIAGGGSVINDSREDWERTFNICWGGVYLGVRTFLPMLMKADEAHIINTSSVNGFWASLGPNVPHTAYSAAKFAVKGFTEALVTDLRINAPHIKCSVVMPGHIGTAIAANSRKVLRRNDSDTLSPEELERARRQFVAAGGGALTDEAIQVMVAERARGFMENAPMTAAAAASVILDGVKAERWRILVGDDAYWLDQAVRRDPENAYEPELHEQLTNRRIGRQGERPPSF
jgi:NAD(P)-dependent dehydrogenase (short-subunit alcohol dehydrogenase family)